VAPSWAAPVTAQQQGEARRGRNANGNANGIGNGNGGVGNGNGNGNDDHHSDPAAHAAQAAPNLTKTTTVSLPDG
jgi:hypothetical protein